MVFGDLVTAAGREHPLLSVLGIQPNLMYRGPGAGSYSYDGEDYRLYASTRVVCGIGHHASNRSRKSTCAPCNEALLMSVEQLVDMAPVGELFLL